MPRHSQVVFVALFVLLLGLWTMLGQAAPAIGTLQKEEINNGWLLLFNGESAFGFSQEPLSAWKAFNGVLKAEQAGYLRTNSAFADFVLKFEARLEDPAAETTLYVRAIGQGVLPDDGYKISIGNHETNAPPGHAVSRSKGSVVRLDSGQWHLWEVRADRDHITVQLDSKPVAEANGFSGAGHIGFNALHAGLELRNLKLQPLKAVAPEEWHSLTPSPEKQSGFWKRVFGGKSKPKQAEWKVQENRIHGDKGLGQVETKNTYNDFIFQIAFSPAQKSRGAIFIRGAKDQMFTGHKITMNEDNLGAIDQVFPHRPTFDTAPYMATVVATERYIDVWMNGILVNEIEDARTTAGPIAIALLDERNVADYSLLQLGEVTRIVVAKTDDPAPPPPTPTPLARPIQTPTTGSSQDANCDRASDHLSKGLTAGDPKEKLYRCNQALLAHCSASMSSASVCIQDAQKALDRQAEEQRVKAAASEQQRQNEAVGTVALERAKKEFVQSHFDEAENSLKEAEKYLGAASIAVIALRSKVRAEQRRKRREEYELFGGTGILGVAGLFTWLILRSRNWNGGLIVESGVDRGNIYLLDHDVIRIGAVSQAGDVKNDIVMLDVAGQISRRHCMIYRKHGKWFLEDCNSTNGTGLNGKAIPPGKPMRLKKGDKIELADNVALTFKLERKKKEN